VLSALRDFLAKNIAMMTEETCDLRDSQSVSQPKYIIEGVGNEAIDSGLLKTQLSEAVQALDLSISWDVFVEEYGDWGIECTRKEFHKIYDLVINSLVGKKLWLVAPIIMAYFNIRVFNWDDDTVHVHDTMADMPSPDDLNADWVYVSSDTVKDEVYDTGCSRWSAVYDESSGKMFGYRYNAAQLYRDCVKAIKWGLSYCLKVRYNRHDANSICCYRKLMTRYTPEEHEEIRELLRDAYGEDV
jgi:hypothetical protein